MATGLKFGLTLDTSRCRFFGRMEVWDTVWALLSCRDWATLTHASLEIGERWFASTKSLPPHFSPDHVCDDDDGTLDSRELSECVPVADVNGWG